MIPVKSYTVISSVETHSCSEVELSELGEGETVLFIGVTCVFISKLKVGLSSNISAKNVIKCPR